MVKRLKINLLIFLLLSVFSSQLFSQTATDKKSPFVVKGFHLDFRIQVMKMPALKKFVYGLSKEGINTVVMEWEASYPFKNQLMIPNQYAYTREEIVGFIAYCKNIGIDVIPLQQSFGHVEYILRNYKYAGLREDQKDYSQVCPIQVEGNKALFTDLFKDMVSTHTSNYIHIGGDETYLLGHCEKCKKKAAEKGKSALYIDHIKMLCDIVVSLGKRPVLWADIALKYPEQIHELPKETVFVDWNYGWDINMFGDHKKLLNSGYEIWGAPAIRSHPDNYFITQWDKHMNNIHDFVPIAAQMGYKGIIVTSWSTSGLYSPVFETTRDIVDLYAIRRVYPITGFNLLVSAYLESIQSANPLNIPKFIANYGQKRYGFTTEQSQSFWDALKGTQFEITQGKPVATNLSVKQLRDSAVKVLGILQNLKPLSEKKEFDHYRLMAAIRVQYLNYMVIEVMVNSPDFNQNMIPKLVADLKALKTEKLDREFIRLNNDTLYPAQLKEENDLRNAKIKLLINRLSKVK